MKSDADKIIDLYDRHAHDYVGDRRHGNGDETAWLDRFCALLKPGSAVLDIGCGSGTPMAEYLVNQGFAVDGIDSSPTLIALCRERLPQRSWCVADMRGLALDRIFDGLLAWDSLFHLSHDDQRRMFPIFKRHASPRAALMFTTGPSHGEAIGSYRGEPLYHASLAPEEYRALLRENGFLVVEHIVEDPDCGGHTVWLAQVEH
ncbi:class I SAM-dependent DNA methyltransferase [Achromobacter xylosoxidans]|uniref:class I SAM-dependent DNA methyltransferase n=1 Tax=Alcaligenes xylosoxydans xylosoxydans TaxID=85698 RepID=UPI0022B907AE|nr:class I SAM-dependent methyltransferase [Achromobacter xylosoxidans]MCZ8393585.1 class I SAM-dependent methyltransferase [Achromobacter xylosoxidans]